MRNDTKQRLTRLIQDGDGRLYATGSFQGFAEFGGNAFTSAGGDDIFVVGFEAL